MYSVRPLLRTTFLILFAGFAARLCTAQALLTASRAAEITAFGGWSPTNPDFGPHTYNGFMAGADFTVYPRHWPVAAALELRYTREQNEIATEQAYLVGPKIEKDFGRWRPYVTALVGDGKIAYHPVPFPHDPRDSGIDLGLGAGFDYDITSHISAKVDFLHQQWSLGTNYFFQPDGANYTLTPWSGTVGIAYHFGLRGTADLRKQHDLR